MGGGVTSTTTTIGHAMSSKTPPGKRNLDFVEETTRRVKATFRIHTSRPLPSPTNLLSPPSVQLAQNEYLSKPLDESITFSQVKNYVANGYWAGLVSALQTLGQCAHLCPPIKPAVDVLLECIPKIDQFTRGRKAYDELALHLKTVLIDLAKHLRESQSPQMRLCVASVICGIEEELVDIKTNITQRRLSRVQQSEDDLEDIDRCYKRIQTLSQQLQSNAVLGTWSIAERQEMNQHLERMNPSIQAQYNAGISSDLHRRACTQDTRLAVLEELRDWIKDPCGAEVYWMNGMAGTGKTTIAYTLCAELEQSCKLGASFFCSRELPECRDVRNIAPTIAYRLARFSPTYRSVLYRVLLDDPDAGKCDVATQFNRLITKPLLEVKAAIPSGMIVVVIDALDECANPSTARLFLDTLVNFATDLPIRFFVTCRPENGLLDKLLLLNRRSRSVFHLHDIEQAVVQDDIETYLRAELVSVRVSSDHIKQIAQRSGKLFIYAATVVRYILPGNRSIDPQKRLGVLLDTKSRSNTKVDREIDGLYEKILSNALEDDNLEPEDIEAIRLVLRTVVCVKEPLTVEALAGLLQLKSPEDARRALEPLHSVLFVPEGKRPVSMLHASFPDYLLDPARSGQHQFFCDRSKHSYLLALGCFEVMKKSLRFNVCGLESSFKLDNEVPDIQDRIDRSISLDLYYACKYWCSHFCEARTADVLASSLEEFLARRLLFWMEVLNLKKCMSAAVDQLPGVLQCLQEYHVPKGALKLARDAYRLTATASASPVAESTPHIYLSILALWNKNSPIWNCYGSRVRGLVSAEGEALRHRRAMALAVWNMGGYVSMIDVSSDGTRIAAALDEDVLVLDARSGNLLVGPFKGHATTIISITFSRDGSQITSASKDKSIRVWDARTGNPLITSLAPLNAEVQSVHFSSDCDRAVCVARDGTILIWDIWAQDVLAGPFLADSDGVGSVAFSPDALHVAYSPSARHVESRAGINPVIRVYDPYNDGKAAVLLNGHTDQVSSMTFSSDSRCIASTSNDCTVIVWDATDGSIVAGPLRGHTSGVVSVVFSSCGSRIISGSLNGDILIWDSRTGQVLARPFQGHTHPITSLSFSPNNACIISTSEDHTIRIWDATIKGALPREPNKHHSNTTTEGNSYRIPDERYGGIECIAFSPKDDCIVAGYGDGTICAWSAGSGETVACLREIHDSAIACLALSPDGGYIASGSTDGLVYILNVLSRNVVVGPLTQEDPDGCLHEPASLAFSSQGTCLACISNTGSVYTWDILSGATLAGPLQMTDVYIHAITYLPDDVCVALGSERNMIHIWNTNTGDVKTTPQLGYLAHELPSYSPSMNEGGTTLAISFSPDGCRVASSSLTDGGVYIWHIASGDILAGPMHGHCSPPDSLAFSQNGSLVASADEIGQKVCVWDSWKGDILFGPFEGHTGAICSLAFLSETRVASSSWDGAIRVWDLKYCSPATGTNLNDDWSMDVDSGWIRTQTCHPLIWVPSELRSYLRRPHNPVLISSKGSLILDFKDTLIGDQWTACFID